MILFISKKTDKRNGHAKIWYDPFFQESVTLDCDGYTIKTKYAPYCIINDKPVKIDKAIQLFKEHNNINYENEHVLDIMKGHGIVYYDYLQEPEIHIIEKNNDISNSDLQYMIRLLNNFDIDHAILHQKNEGITIEIQENNDAEYSIEDFLQEISKNYTYREN